VPAFVGGIERAAAGEFGQRRHQFLIDACAYFNAADILIRDASPDVNQPAYFLMSHALELMLKAYILACGGSYDEVVSLGHNIQKAHARAEALGLRIEDDHRVLIERLSEFHDAFIFRYPVVKKDDGHLILRGALVYPAEVLKIIESIFLRVNGPVIMARLDASGAGSFPVETWHMGQPAPEQK
jgi:hypothetical protein